MVLGPITLHDGATVGANATVIHDVPAGVTVVAPLARPLGEVQPPPPVTMVADTPVPRPVVGGAPALAPGGGPAPPDRRRRPPPRQLPRPPHRMAAPAQARGRGRSRPSPRCTRPAIAPRSVESTARPTEDGTPARRTAPRTNTPTPPRRRPGRRTAPMRPTARASSAPPHRARPLP
ncbi:hypothetical protein ACFQZK_18685 [Rhodococcus aetherivorans]